MANNDENIVASFSQDVQVYKPIIEVPIPAAPSQWRRWMTLLDKSSKPPLWLSEGFSLALLGAAVAFTISAIDRWTGGNLWLAVGQNETIIIRTWICACGYSVLSVSLWGIGLYAFLGSRHIRQHDADFVAIVKEEMNENVNLYLNKKRAKKQRKEKQAEDAAVAETKDATP